MKRRAASLALACGLGLALLPAFRAPTATQEKPPEKPAAPQAPFVRCTHCSNVGIIPCSEHPKPEMEWERDVQYCSAIADCAVCGGAGWLDCAHCENPDATKWLERKKAGIASLKSQSQKLDGEMGRPMRKVFSDHFMLVWEIDQLKVDKRMLGAHELNHVYAKRLEVEFADYREAFKVGEREMGDRHKVFVWYQTADQNECSLKFCGNSSPKGVKLLGSSSAYSVCGNKQNFTGDEQLHRNIMHSVGHLLLAHQNPAFWIGNIKGGWADEGLAHWFEQKYFGKCDNYCYEEQNTNVDFKGGVWKPIVRKMVALGDLPPVATVLDINTDQLTLPMHAVAFSYVDYFLAHDGAKFSALCKQLKAKIPARDAMKKIYDFTPFEFEELWKAWVLETYPVR